MGLRFLIILFLWGALFPNLFGDEAKPRVRPHYWAQKVIGSSLKNWHQLNKKVFRSEQPSLKEMILVEKMGIKNILNLRFYHDDKDLIKETQLKLYSLPMKASKVTEEQLVMAVQILQNLEEPVLIHCWHGSDRTGSVCAAYRIAVEGWTVENAIDEMMNGDFNFHETFDNIPALLNQIDWDTFKEKLTKEKD